MLLFLEAFSRHFLLTLSFQIKVRGEKSSFSGEMVSSWTKSLIGKISLDNSTFPEFSNFVCGIRIVGKLIDYSRQFVGATKKNCLMSNS